MDIYKCTDNEWMAQFVLTYLNMDGLAQERSNFIANALKFRLSCTNPSIWSSSRVAIASFTTVMCGTLMW